MKFRLALLLPAICLIAQSCSSGGGGAPAPTDGPSALAQLSESDQAAFASWKGSIHKACHAGEAFGQPALDPAQITVRGVDFLALLAKNANSLVIQASDGRFAILGEPTPLQGTGKSNYDQTETVNGKEYHVQAEFRQNGSTCEAYLYGQKVYETAIFQSLDILEYWDPANPPAKTEAERAVSDGPGTGLSVIQSPPFLDSLSGWKAQTVVASTFVGARLGLAADPSLRLFIQEQGTRLDLTARFTSVGANGSTWFSLGSLRMAAPTAWVADTLGQSPRVLESEIRVRVPLLTYAGSTNSSDEGTLKLKAEIQVTPPPALPAGSTKYSFQLKSLESEGNVQLDQSQASACVKDRALRFKAFDVSLNAPQLNSVDEAVEACNPLGDAVRASAMTDGTFRSVVATLLAGVDPDKIKDYRGWDAVVIQLAHQALTANQNIALALDPSGIAVPIQKLSDELGTVHALLPSYANLSKLGERIEAMAATWALFGKSVADSELKRILVAVDRVIVPFETSAGRLLDGLADAPAGHEAEVAFAEQIDAPYKAEALKARAAAVQLDYNDWEGEVFGQVLQTRPTLGQLQDWTVRLGKIQTAIAPFPALAKAKGALTGAAIHWADQNEAKFEELPGLFGDLNNAADPFTDATDSLVTALQASLAANRDALSFAAALSPEYKVLAVDVRARAKSQGVESWGEDFFRNILKNRPALATLKSWKAVLTKVEGFNQREAARLAGETFTSSNDSARAKLLERALQEGWTGGEFAELESIVELGKRQESTSCTDTFHKGDSSLAECLGSDLFSALPGKFFAPGSAGRYGALAPVFQGFLSQLSDFSLISIRSDLGRAFFNSSAVIWSTCEAAGFNARQADLSMQVTALATETDGLKKFDIEDKIHALLRECKP